MNKEMLMLILLVVVPLLACTLVQLIPSFESGWKYTAGKRRQAPAVLDSSPTSAPGSILVPPPPF